MPSSKVGREPRRSSLQFLGEPPARADRARLAHEGSAAPTTGPDELHAPRVEPRQAKRSSLVGAIGYAIHGFILLALAIAALLSFGPIFWFISTIGGLIAMLSFYDGYAALKAHRASLRRSGP